LQETRPVNTTFEKPKKNASQGSISIKKSTNKNYVSSDSFIAYGGYVGARTGLVKAKTKIIQNKIIKNISFLN